MAIKHTFVSAATQGADSSKVSKNEWNADHTIDDGTITKTKLAFDPWPVGSVFISVVSTNPGTLLGFGTWVAFATGQMLVGIDSGQTEFDTVEETGGEKTHTLTTSEMPVHTHVQDSHNHTQNSHNHTQDAFAPRIINSGTAGTVGVQGSSGAANANASNAATTATNQAATAVNQATTATNQNAGSGAAHNNLPPYIVVYCWKRTA